MAARSSTRSTGLTCRSVVSISIKDIPPPCGSLGCRTDATGRNLTRDRPPGARPGHRKLLIRLLESILVRNPNAGRRRCLLTPPSILDSSSHRNRTVILIHTDRSRSGRGHDQLCSKCEHSAETCGKVEPAMQPLLLCAAHDHAIFGRSIAFSGSRPPCDPCVAVGVPLWKAASRCSSSEAETHKAGLLEPGPFFMLQCSAVRQPGPGRSAPPRARSARPDGRRLRYRSRRPRSPSESRR